MQPYSIVGGNPARHIRYRLPEEICAELLRQAWWRFNPKQLEGLPMGDPARFTAEMEKRLPDLEPWQPAALIAADLL